MSENIFEYIECLIQNRHISSDLYDGVAVYFIQDIAEDGEPISITILSEFSHMEKGVIFCRYAIDINEQQIINITEPINAKPKTPEAKTMKALLSMCSNKIILQELQAQRNGFLRALGNPNQRS